MQKLRRRRIGLRVYIMTGISAGLLGLALAAHWKLLRLLPDPIFYPDSRYYAIPAISWITRHKFNLVTVRTPGYSLFLLAILKIKFSFFAVLVAQHVLLLITGILCALIYYFEFEKSLWRALLVVWVAWLLPRPLAATQMIMSETLYGTFLLLFVFLFFIALRRSSHFLWGVLGVGATVCASVRPVGLSLALAVPLTVVCLRRVKATRTQLGVYALTLALTASGWCLYNYRHYQFWGFSEFGGMSFFGNAARYLDVERIPQDERRILEPIYRKNPARIFDLDWVLWDANGPVFQLAQAYPKDFDRRLRHLAFRAIANHPIAYGTDRLRNLTSYFLRFELYTRDVSPVPLLIRGFDWYWEWTEKYPEGRSLMRLRPDDAAAWAVKIESEGLFPFTPRGVFRLLWPLVYLEGFLPAMALFSFVLGLLSKKPISFVVLFIITLCHLGLTIMGPGYGPRLAIPVEPLYLITAAAGLPLFLKTLLKFAAAPNQQ